MSDNLVRVTAPGLPTWPRLYFDPKTKRARISAKLVTWRSHLWAGRMEGLLLLIVYSIPAYFVYQWVVNGDGDFSRRLGYGIVGSAIAFSLSRPLLGSIFRPFFAKIIFCQRVKVWFTPTAFAFSSRFYNKPVVVWRSWKGNPVQGRFDLADDEEAEMVKESLSFEQKVRAKHLSMAKVLRVIITTINPSRLLGAEHQANLVRSIPLTEIDGNDAQKFTMVLAAASSLTSLKASDASKSSIDVGIDIDSLK
jgi:hypothetical protein